MPKKLTDTDPDPQHCFEAEAYPRPTILSSAHGKKVYSVLCLYSKQRNAGKSRLNVKTIFINTVLKDWGRYTDFLRADSLFWEDGGGGGLLAFSEVELRFPILFVESLVCVI